MTSRMTSRPKLFLYLLITVALSWTAINLYKYIFFNSAPELKIAGIEHENYYSGDVQCIVTGNDSYKVANISAWLDGKNLVNRHKISKKYFEYTVPISTKTISSGKHCLKIEIENGTYNRQATNKEIDFYVDNMPLQAAFIKSEIDNKVFQGRTLHIQFQTNKEMKHATVKALSKNYDCFQESDGAVIYECFVPISCEEIPNEYLANVDITDKVGNILNLNLKFHVVAYPFKKQNVQITPEKIKLEEEAGLSEKLLDEAVENITKNSPKKKLWQGIFYAPTEIRAVTTDFGTVRTTKHRGLYAHKAVDVINAPRSVVWATQDGIVALKERFAHSGNTVAIDHGHGIISLFFHLDNFANINVGDKIKRGNPIGTLGMTGHATGYHLHWEMRINNIAVDPLQWIKQGF